jgi:hypothetical protein
MYWVSTVLAAALGLWAWWCIKSPAAPKPLDAQKAAIEWAVQSGLLAETASEALDFAVQEAAAELAPLGVNVQDSPALLGVHAAARLRLGPGYLPAHPAIKRVLADDRLELDFRSQFLQAWLVSCIEGEQSNS